MHHMGVDKTLYLARKVSHEVPRGIVQQVVRRCVRCQSIDPSPRVHEPGELQVKENWKRLAVDVTHYRGVEYLTMVDCGPGRFALWRSMKSETAEEIAGVLNGVFLEHGPVEEVLSDNGTAFRSETLRRTMAWWNVRQYFRAAYRPSGNGIVERNHRTVKAVAERGEISPEEAVFWYNMSPRSGQTKETVPQESVFCYTWRHPRVVPVEREGGTSGSIQVGDEVWVKPPNVRCTTQWGRGTVTATQSRNNVSVDGVPRHVLDVRPVEGLSSEDEEVDDGQQDNGAQGSLQPRAQRSRRPPQWLQDYEL